GDVADEDESRAARLGVADESRGATPELRNGAGRRLDSLRPERLHRVDHDERRGCCATECGDDIGEVSLGAESDGRFAKPQAVASSPERYATGAPVPDSLAAASSRSVDLPMPGSPPTSTAEPGTRPPPSTRSSSAMPVTSLDASSVVSDSASKVASLPALRPL